jgi:hypothetical protein
LFLPLQIIIKHAPDTGAGIMTEKKPWKKRKERKEWGRRSQSEDPELEVVHAHAAGIDVGNGMHYVAVRPDRDPQPVRRFECFTADLHCLAAWLQRCGVKTVAMQSRPVCIGFRCMTFWKNRGSRFIWLTPAHQESQLGLQVTAARP